MDFTNLKGILVSARGMVTYLGEALSKLLPFPAENISGLIVLVFCFFISNALFNMFGGKYSNIVTKLLGMGGLFYFLWIW